MSVSDPAPKTIWFPLIPGLIVLAVLAAAVFGEKGILCAVQSNQQKELLLQQVQALELANQGLRKEIDALRSDPRYLEAISRKELGMVREDELVYQFRSPNGSAAQVSAAEPVVEPAEPGR
ncbi:FtsB family cell division protein [Trichloromonas sp.]|uniref:FtsB family cell division protein n=1 Tax=Trichloromonas sp. TaxID=3069249 RepID=UPI003D81BF2B